MSGIFLTTKEIENIYKTYEHYGEARLGEFIQAIWKEAFSEGYEKAMMQLRQAYKEPKVEQQG